MMAINMPMMIGFLSLPWRQMTACHCNHNSVVAAKYEIDFDDHKERHQYIVFHQLAPRFAFASGLA
jgi:hypothetical protein